MNRINRIIRGAADRVGSNARELHSGFRLASNVIAISMATGVSIGALLFPGTAAAQSSGIGSVVNSSTTNNVPALIEAFKLLLAAAGVVAVGWGIYGLTWGRNGDNARDFGVMKMVGFMIGGAAATSLGLLTSTWSSTIWGSDNSGTGTSNFSLN